MLVSTTQGDKLINSAPYASVAFAGHTTAGGWCACNNPESCTGGFGGLSVRIDDPTLQDEGATQQNATQDNLTTGFGVALLMLMSWLKLRA
jgi:hypothetical protein